MHVLQFLCYVTVTIRQRENVQHALQDTFSKMINAFILPLALIQVALSTPTLTVRNANLVTTFKTFSAGKSIINVMILIIPKMSVTNVLTPLHKDLIVSDSFSYDPLF